MSLQVSDADLAVGELFENAVHEHRLTVANPGREPLTVVTLRGNCDWQKSHPKPPFTVPAGGRQDVTLVLHPKSVSDCGRGRGQERLTVPVGVQFRTDGSAVGSVVWELTGTLKPTLHIGGTQGGLLALGAQTAKQLGAYREFPLTAALPVASVRVDGPSVWKADVRGGGEPGRFLARVRYVGPSVPGEIDHRIKLVPLDERGRDLPESQLWVTAELVPDIVAEPRAVRLGRHPVGAEVEDTFVLRSLNGTPFTVQRIDAPAGVKTARTDEPSNAVSISVRLPVRMADEQQVTVVVHVIDGQGQAMAVSVPVSYRGYAPGSEGEARP